MLTKLLAGIVIASTAACGGSGAASKNAQSSLATDSPVAVKSFCAYVTDWAETIRQIDLADRAGQGSYDAQIQRLNREVSFFKGTEGAAPPSIATDIHTLVHTPKDSVRISDADRRIAAGQRVDRYVVEKCGLRFTFSDRDWTQSAE
jgi:hypothetical protein